MSFHDGGIELDLVSSGRGLQQTLLLLAHLYTHPRTVLLLDEPDAHLEILRQRQIYQILTQTAESQDCQVIAASHSEVLLNEATDRDIVVAFVGKPHRIDDRRSRVLKSLRSIGFDQRYPGRADQVGPLFGRFDGPGYTSGLREVAEPRCSESPRKAVCSLCGEFTCQSQRTFLRFAGGQVRPDRNRGVRFATRAP